MDFIKKSHLGLKIIEVTMKMDFGFKLWLITLVLTNFWGANVGATTLTKIGYFNVDAAFAQEHEAQKKSKELENKERQILDAEQKARTDLEAKMAKFKESMPKLSEKARQDQETALGNEINLLQQQFTQRRLELNQERQKISSDLESKNRLVVESIAKQENFSAIFSSAALVYVSEEIKKNDITNKVAEKYNKDFPVKEEPKKKPATPVQSGKKK